MKNPDVSAAILADKIQHGTARAVDRGTTPNAGIARDYQREGELGRGEFVALFTERLHDYGAAVHPSAEADLPARLVELLDGRGSTPRALTLVPDRHICVARADDIVHTVPELLARLAPDRPSTLISARPRTAISNSTAPRGTRPPHPDVMLLLDP